MKKAKILLSAIAVFGIVGGAMALKARTTVAYEFCNTSNVCAKSFAQAVSTQTQQSPWVRIAQGTTDLSATGLACTNASHPCTSVIFTLAE